jgi:hypothetical protein
MDLLSPRQQLQQSDGAIWTPCRARVHVQSGPLRPANQQRYWRKTAQQQPCGTCGAYTRLRTCAKKARRGSNMSYFPCVVQAGRRCALLASLVCPGGPATEDTSYFCSCPTVAMLSRDSRLVTMPIRCRSTMVQLRSLVTRYHFSLIQQSATVCAATRRGAGSSRADCR